MPSLHNYWTMKSLTVAHLKSRNFNYLPFQCRLVQLFELQKLGGASWGQLEVQSTKTGIFHFLCKHKTVNTLMVKKGFQFPCMEPVGRLSVPYSGYTSLVFNIKRWTLAAKLSKASHLSARFPVPYDGCNVHQVYIQLQILPRNKLTSTSLAFGFMCMFSRKGQQQSHSLLYDSDSTIFVCTNRDWPRTIQKWGIGICSSLTSSQVRATRPIPPSSFNPLTPISD